MLHPQIKHTPEQIARAYIDSQHFQDAWTKFETTMENYGWGFNGLNGGIYLTGSFSSGPYPATVTTSIDLDQTREQFEGNINWQTIELVNRCLFAENIAWMSWWRDTYPEVKKPFRQYDGYHHTPFGDALASAVHDELRPRVRNNTGFQEGRAQLFRGIKSDEVQSTAKEQLQDAAESNLWSAAKALDQLGFSRDRMVEMLEEQLNQVRND